MSAFLGPLANQADYEKALQDTKAAVELSIAAYADVDKQPPSHLVVLDNSLSQQLQLTGSGGGGGGLTSAQTTAAVTASLVATGLNSLDGNTDGLETALATIAGSLSSILSTQVDRSYWAFLSGYTEDAISTNNSTNTSLDTSGVSSSIPVADLQASVTISPHPDVLTAFYGGAVNGLSQAEATALINDSIRWGFGGTTLSADEGESLGYSSGALFITGSNVADFVAHSTSVDFPPKLNIKFFQRAS